MPKDANQIWQAAQEKKRVAAVAQARKLLDAQQFDAAERTVTTVDNSIYGAVALAQMYRAHLQQLVNAGTHRSDQPRVAEVFRRALHWAQSAYPEPHTQIEADNYAAGRAENLADLVKIIGYDPTAR